MKECSQFTETEGPADFFTVFAGNNRYTNPVVLHQLIRIGDFDFFNIDGQTLCLQAMNQRQGFFAEMAAQGRVEPDIHATGSGKLKNARALREVRVAISAVETPRQAATFSATTGRYMGSFRRDLGFGRMFLGIR